MNTQNWIERFDKKFYEGDSNSVHCYKHKVYATPAEIKNFIRQERKELLDGIRKEIELRHHLISHSNFNLEEAGRAQGLQDAISIVERRLKE